MFSDAPESIDEIFKSSSSSEEVLSKEELSAIPISEDMDFNVKLAPLALGCLPARTFLYLARAV
jgi:hypothetical protein